MSWKCCYLKFKNTLLTVATDGYKIRVRGGGLRPQEDVLVDCDEKDQSKFRAIEMDVDAVLLEPIQVREYLSAIQAAYDNLVEVYSQKEMLGYDIPKATEILREVLFKERGGI